MDIEVAEPGIELYRNLQTY